MIIVLKLVKCEVLGLNESFQGVCFGHVFSKACQYAITNNFFLQEFQICFNQIYPIKWTKMYNLTLKNLKKVNKNGTRLVQILTWFVLVRSFNMEFLICL
jgi:hypothetical protein